MIKVASYCRVSTDKDDQANSFEAQQRYFKEYIERQPDWELYDVYADEGITGTSTKKRAAFHRMIHDAHMGRFRLILTKEVSRFSRNILDTIAYTRELRQLGVGVLFMNDGINTLDPDAELRLSIMGSIAQEESRKTSTRVKWGQTRQMERGVVFGTSLLGYDVKDGKISINPEGAELVKLIFQKYGIEKKGTTVIAREMREAGFRTYRGNSKWSNSHIIKILKNEKYVGDLIQKKTYTPDYLTHAKKYNHGEEALVVIQNHHPPIIDRELWNTVQAELKKKKCAWGAGIRTFQPLCVFR
ncbi:MAG: recombinase family protein [Oscillospiraceae bacterium]